MLDEMGDWMPDNEVDAIDNAQAEADEAQDPTAAIVYIYITIQTLISVICVVLSCTIIMTDIYILYV